MDEEVVVIAEVIG
jgi:hypothetical protein